MPPTKAKKKRPAIPSPWLNVREAAAYVGVSVDAIYDACASGALRSTKLGYRTLRIKQDWLDLWLEERSRVA